MNECKCAWCDTVGEPPKHGSWRQLPTGWYTLLGDSEDGSFQLYACSLACADSYSERERVRSEFKKTYKAEYQNGRRNEPQSETFQRASARLAEKYGPDWCERFGLVGVHGL